jgi:hypothetical protein
LPTGRTVDIGRSGWVSPGGEVSKGGIEVRRCKEKAGWTLKMVGDEESASEICRDIEDRSSCGITAETLNEVEKGNQTKKRTTLT